MALASSALTLFIGRQERHLACKKLSGGNPMECESYKGIKLLEQAMKVVERIFEQRIRQHFDTDDKQFGFMKGKGTTDAIFIVQQMQKFRAKGKKLYFGFMDLEKAFDRIPREVIRWAMYKLGVEEWLISAVMSMYTGAKTVEQFMVTVKVFRLTSVCNKVQL